MSTYTHHINSLAIACYLPLFFITSTVSAESENSSFIPSIDGERIAALPTGQYNSLDVTNIILGEGLYGATHHKRQNTPVGKSHIWAEGDISSGRDNSELSITGIGAGKKFNDRFYVAISTGKKDYKTDLNSETKLDSKGNYSALDFQLKLTDKKAPLWLSVTGISTRGKATVTRNNNIFGVSTGN